MRRLRKKKDKKKYYRCESIPRRMAPRISKIVASIHACRNVRTLDPTEVPNEFATSFAPIPNAKKNAMIKVTIMIQRTSLISVTIVAPVLVADANVVIDDDDANIDDGVVSKRLLIVVSSILIFSW